MELFLASSNKHKFGEMSTILKNYGAELKLKSIPLIEPDFGSIEKIAEYKARQAFEKIKRPVVCEDTGVYFDAYNDFPGIFAKRVFLGIGFEGLLALIRAAKNKSARFCTAVCYFDGKISKTFSGEMKGALLDHVVSENKDRLPYEKLFVPHGFSRALVDLSIEEKNRISHRSQATNKLGKWLKSRAKKV